MKNVLKVTSACAMVLLLVACGGGNTETSTQKTSLLSMRSISSTNTRLAPAAYSDVLQRIYLSFFGRPVDPKGLEFWSKIFSDRGMPTSINGFIDGYATNSGIRELIDMFANSSEFQGLYTGNNSAFINAVYLNSFNRNAEADGRAFWGGFMDRGQLTRAQVAMCILSGAQNSDKVVAAKKVQAATFFTAALDLPMEVAMYDGSEINQAVRDLLSTITATTDMAAFETQINAFIASMLSDPGTFPASESYVGYSYVQNMTNEPSYSARYTYSRGGVVSPPPAGSLVFGETPQTINWSRITGAQFSYDAPVTASVALPAIGNLPKITMLCRATNDLPQKSTDVVVARSATRLTDASQLAGQTLSVYREDCAIGGSRVQAFVFDVSGNLTYNSGAGTVSMNAATVNKILQGEVQFDLVTGKFLTFSAYSYKRQDDTTAYAVVQHLGSKLTGLGDGILTLWSQD